MATTVTLGTPVVTPSSGIVFPFTIPGGALYYPGGIPQVSREKDTFREIQTLMKMLLTILNDKGLNTPAQAAGHSLVYDSTLAANVIVFQ